MIKNQKPRAADLNSESVMQESGSSEITAESEQQPVFIESIADPANQQDIYVINKTARLREAMLKQVDDGKVIAETNSPEEGVRFTTFLLKSIVGDKIAEHVTDATELLSPNKQPRTFTKRLISDVATNAPLFWIFYAIRGDNPNLLEIAILEPMGYQMRVIDPTQVYDGLQFTSKIANSRVQKLTVRTQDSYISGGPGIETAVYARKRHTVKEDLRPFYFSFTINL